MGLCPGGSLVRLHVLFFLMDFSSFSIDFVPASLGRSFLVTSRFFEHHHHHLIFLFSTTYNFHYVGVDVSNKS